MAKKKSNRPACFSTKIDPGLVSKLKEDLLAQEFILTQPNYTQFQAKKKGISLTLYESGVLTVQGKEKDSFLEFYLEPEILQDFSYTHPTANIDTTARIGIDEAGKGDFFGPLCTVGVYATGPQIEKLAEIGVKDSKRFNDASILKIGKEIQKIVTSHSVIIFPEKYNELYGKIKNLNHLLAWCHITCMEALSKKTGCNKVILDQFAHESLIINFLKKKKLSLEVTQIVRAEADVVVASASILARMAFVQGIDKLSEKWNLTFPKGASQKVLEVGKEFCFRNGMDKLPLVAKKHFKTFGEIERNIK